VTDPRRLVAAAAVLAIAPAAGLAQTPLTLSQSGGALGQNATFTLQGEPQRDFLLWFDLEEHDTRLRNGVVTNVGFGLLDLAMSLPGFVGRTDAAGKAVATAQVPNDPALEVETLSLQAIYADLLDEVSNVTRLTPCASGSFRDALHAPWVPLVAGLSSPQADGSVLLVDTTLPLIHRYVPSLEEFEVVNLNGALGLLSTCTTLPDGRILMTGGIDVATGQPQTRSLLLDPATGGVTNLDLLTPRAGHAAAIAGNGELLISGGFTNLDFTDVNTLFAGISATTELFDPVTATFRAGPTMLESKALHSATTMADGKVLQAGGLTLVPFVNVPFVSQTAVAYNPKSGAFGLPLLMNAGRLLHSAALLDDDRILVAGGLTVDFTTFLSTGNYADLGVVALDDGEIWKSNFFGGKFTATPGMQAGRALPSVTALPGAKALVAGGFDLSITGADWTQWLFAPQATADLMAASAFAPTGSMANARIAPIALLLADGTVLLVGGGAAGAEIYQP